MPEHVRNLGRFVYTIMFHDLNYSSSLDVALDHPGEPALGRILFEREQATPDGPPIDEHGFALAEIPTPVYVEQFAAWHGLSADLLQHWTDAAASELADEALQWHRLTQAEVLSQGAGLGDDSFEQEIATLRRVRDEGGMAPIPDHGIVVSAWQRARRVPGMDSVRPPDPSLPGTHDGR